MKALRKTTGDVLKSGVLLGCEELVYVVGVTRREQTTTWCTTAANGPLCFDPSPLFMSLSRGRCRIGREHEQSLAIWRAGGYD